MTGILGLDVSQIAKKISTPAWIALYPLGVSFTVRRGNAAAPPYMAAYLVMQDWD